MLPGDPILTFMSQHELIIYPECWGHRGVGNVVPTYLLALLMWNTQASAAYPENTLASFEAAIRDGAEGIESGISYRG
jgi:phosphatidylglycerol phospholipase C